MSLFRIIIPTYNNADLLPRMVGSIRRQTFTDYHLVIVDDMSTDDTPAVIEALAPDKAVRMTQKGLGGGARNEGTKYFTDDEYTFFLDDDDVLLTDDVLEKIADAIYKNNHPDIVQINYRKTINGEMRPHKDRYQRPATPMSVCMSIPVAPWTKVVKTSLVVPFPDGLINGEDVLQHIQQCDVCETAALVNDDCVNWIIRPGSASQNHANPLWSAGWYLEAYTLMCHLDTFRHDWAKARAERRLAQIDRQITKGVR